ncbi:uncharacterized protein FOMMEDRAFT_158367 [Fomitiporia mediterranea MF3/22]|uniref:uncharacterized protein n=1 Tax=Fomitiporia mediterranea (strain MF3/22) TaxID=694068 RepID=UPI00044082BC|nr:uncharacterized protein FOMMEDRAFT_158367 [Fomitiporia mediterranea MF3/22]EJD01235.1 hypothetical protein FOMMEDRAFT_158367 [Fomitiporia mediterranea MF3/22]
MGFTGLVHWRNAPTTGLDLVRQNIIRNHAGVDQGRWHLAIRSFRTASGPMHGFQADRSMCVITLNDNVSFVSLEDPAAPTISDVVTLTQMQASMNHTDSAGSPSGSSHAKHPQPIEPPHYRTTLVTVSPSGALETLLTQLGARWTSTRQPSTSQRNQAISTGNQVIIDGSIFSIGTDWLVRVGNVHLTGGAVKGMLLEAEYLPLPKLQSTSQDGTSELLSNLLVSIIPEVLNSTAVAVAMHDSLWEETQWNCNEPEANGTKNFNAGTDREVDEDEDVFVYGDEDNSSAKQKGDWIGNDRDRRSAFLVIGSLRTEGIL